MKQYLRNRVSKSASYVEILLSVFIMLGTAIVSVTLARDLVHALTGLLQGEAAFSFESFVGQIMQLIIGVEFVKMISKHTPESTIEVLMLVVARKIIVDEPAFTDISIGIASIAALFLIKRFLTQKTNPDGCILEGETSIGEANAILRTRLETSLTTIRDLVTAAMEEQRILPVSGAQVLIGQHVFKIYSMRDGTIDAVEAIPARRSFRWPAWPAQVRQPMKQDGGK